MKTSEINKKEQKRFESKQEKGCTNGYSSVSVFVLA